jgi:hypothetical protein
MLSARSTLDRLLYGALSEPHPLKVIAVLGNYALSLHFCREAKLHCGALCMVLSITLLAYNMRKSAMGISTIWSYAYGYHVNPTLHHHLLYWVPCSLLIVPWPLLNATFKKHTGFLLWPWTGEFFIIAIAAHGLFAAFGKGIRVLSESI